MEKVLVISVKKSKMDIDEFLDRELSDLGLNTEKAQDTTEPDSGEAKPSSDGAKSISGKASLEKAEEEYVQLWHVLMQQKLKWNKEIYDQLTALSRQFSGVLSQAYNELKKKADAIYALISRAKAAFQEGKKDMPFKIYAEIQEINNSIPNIFFEEKKMIQDQIINFYNELRSKTDNELIGRTYALAQQINQLIGGINAAISNNDMAKAMADYGRCVELYTQVPEGFLHYKSSAGIRILEIYKNLSIYSEISVLHKQLGQQQPSWRQYPKQTKPGEALAAKSPVKTKAINLPASQPQPAAQASAAGASAAREDLLAKKRERAKKNIAKGFYNEASKDVEEALQIEPADAESKALRAKIKTLS